jgi:His-Xaa-Ser system protein HxsD
MQPINISETTDALEFVTQNNEYLGVHINTKIYPLEAVLKTAYHLTQRAFFHVEPTDDHQLWVRAKIKDKSEDIEKIIYEFCNVLVDFTLRLSISKETEDVRNLILAHAFSQTTLIGTEFETSDYIEDPLNIGQSDIVNSG